MFYTFISFFYIFIQISASSTVSQSGACITAENDFDWLTVRATMKLEWLFSLTINLLIILEINLLVIGPLKCQKILKQCFRAEADIFKLLVLNKEQFKHKDILLTIIKMKQLQPPDEFICHNYCLLIFCYRLRRLIISALTVAGTHWLWLYQRL